MNAVKFVRKENVEISANEQWVVLRDGNVNLAQTFGGKSSRSGYTHWPEWIQEGAFPIKPLRSLTEEKLLEKFEAEDVIAFSGGGSAGIVYTYHACIASVIHHLSTWRHWRDPNNTKFEPEPYCGNNDAAIIARAISFNIGLKEGMRLTDTEVSRHSTAISKEWDEGSGNFRWNAILRIWPFQATALDHYGKPKAWIVCSDEIQLQPEQKDILFIEDIEE